MFIFGKTGKFIFCKGEAVTAEKGKGFCEKQGEGRRNQTVPSAGAREKLGGNPFRLGCTNNYTADGPGDRL